MNTKLIFAHEGEIRFEALNAENLQAYYTEQMAESERLLQQIYQPAAPDFESGFGLLDNLLNVLATCQGLLYIVAYTQPEASTRNKALELIPAVDKQLTAIQLDEKLYRALKAYAQQASGLPEHRAKFVRETIEEFERNGFALDAEARAKVMDLKNKLADLSNEFDANIAAHHEEHLLTEEELRGLPADYLAARRTEDGKIKVDLTYPSYRPLMKFAENGDLRRKMLLRFLNRAHEGNGVLLPEILKLRRELAQVLGFSSYAEYSLASKMAHKPATVWQFEEELKAKVRTKAEADYAELLEAKRNLLDAEADTVFAWESAFVENHLLKQRYNFDQEAVKAYFPLNSVTEGIFEIVNRLYQVDILPVAETAWHTDVKVFDMLREGKKFARFYLDMHPRPNKYGHAAMFPIVPGCKGTAPEMPQAALVCNFPAPSAQQPSLLTHDDVVTLFHEFGHLLHGLLSETELASQSGTSVARDFVETPSQMFEHWAWQYQSLSLFARHYKTGELLPKSLFERMWAARNVNSGNLSLQQIYYGTVDMYFHDKWSPGESVDEVETRLQHEITLFGHMEGAHFCSSFGHLNGYAAGYYGYLWARVFADDFFSAFEGEALLNSVVGERYRHEVLARGASRNENDMVRSFLGREAQQDAFLQQIGLEIHKN